uniref:Putative secreted protein n=1 Tax=Ixodes ricinus TaxID=34613 RepID=A0A6B0V2R5_IXORI
MTFFMYFFSSGLSLSIADTTLLSGRMPLCFWNNSFNVVSMVSCQGGNVLATQTVRRVIWGPGGHMDRSFFLHLLLAAVLNALSRRRNSWTASMRYCDDRRSVSSASDATGHRALMMLCSLPSKDHTCSQVWGQMGLSRTACVSMNLNTRSRCIPLRTQSSRYLSLAAWYSKKPVLSASLNIICSKCSAVTRIPWFMSASNTLST